MQEKFQHAVYGAAIVAALAAGAVQAQTATPVAKPLDNAPLISALDANRDSCVSHAEWTQGGAPESAYQMLKDDKGCVTLARMNAEAPPPGIDTNVDGKVTLVELKAFDKKMSAQMKREAALAAKIDVGAEAQKIQNLMSRRMFYHSVGQNERELALWAKQHPIRWAQNQGCWNGMASLKVYYDDVNRQMQAAGLAKMSKLNPAIKNVPENRFVGNTILHTLTTPIIEVAGDGQSAKGMWYTPGVILTTEDAKTPEGLWIWERYGVDFIKENGQWVFLNVQVNTDFMNPMGKPLQKQGPDAAAMGSEGGGPDTHGIKIPGPDIAKETYREFGVTRVPTLTPRLPEPYRTLSETFQYADCGSKS